MTRGYSRWIPLAALLSTLIPRIALGGEGDGGVPDGGRAPDGGAVVTDALTEAVAGDGGAPRAPVEPLAPAAPAAPPLPEAPPPPENAQRLEALTVVGTRESRTAGSAHVLRPRDLERMKYDNPETVVKQVPGVYARGEDGMGLRPNIGIRGTSPDRSKKVTLMEDGILFGPAPYAAPAAYYFPLITRMEMVRVIKGPAAVSFGPQTVGGAIDLVTRSIPPEDAGWIDAAVGSFGYGKLNGYYGASTARSGYLIEGVHLRSTGFKELDGGGNTGFEKNEWMWKGKYLLSTNPKAPQTIGLKLGYSDEDSRESYLGLTDADLRANPNRRYRASRFDRMQWHRTQVAGTYQARFGQAFTLNAAVYRNDFSRTWRKVNRMGPRMGTSTPIAFLLANPDTVAGAVARSVLTGEEDWSSNLDTIYIGPNQRQFVSQGVQAVGGWAGTSGPLDHRVEVGARFHYDRIDRLHTEDGFRMIGGNLIHDGTPTLVTANSRSWVRALALHAIDAVTWRRLTLTPGVRVEIIDTATRDRLAGTEQVGARQNVVLPGMGAYAALTPALGVLAGVYRGFSPAVPPSADGEPGQPAATGPAPSRPELSVNYEAGVRYAPRRVRAEAIGFFNDYQNLTSVCTFASGCSSTQEGNQYDAGRAHIYGVEVFARVDAIVGKRFAIPFSLAYTYTHTKLLETFASQDPSLGNVEAGDELPFVPRNQAVAQVAFETPRGAFAVEGFYVSAMRERAGPSGQAATAAEPLTDASFLLNVTANAAVTKRGRVYINVRNVLGADDIASRFPFGARPVAPRWVQVGTTWSF